MRRRELERNIKREWTKVITLLNQYACVQTGVKFSVSQQPTKGKRIVLFSTKGNKTTRENVINVFGAKTMTALVAMDLKLQLEPTSGPSQKQNIQERNPTRDIKIVGFVSRPVHGEGRQTPDRQLFYVNSRPCGLPQFAKVFNEVYRSFNSSQSPFIFADIQLDTHLYDVNVSPDKRTILLHDQSRMLDNLRDALIELFEQQDYTLPISQIMPLKQTPLKNSMILGQNFEDRETAPAHASTSADVFMFPSGSEGSPAALVSSSESSGVERIRNLAAAKSLAREAQASSLTTQRAGITAETQKKVEVAVQEHQSPIGDSHSSDRAEERAVRIEQQESNPELEETDGNQERPASDFPAEADIQDDDFFARLAKMKRSFLPASLQDEKMEGTDLGEPPIPAIAKPSKPPESAPLSVATTRASKRPSQEVATITIGDHTVTSIIGTPPKRPRRDEEAVDCKVPEKRSGKRKAAATLPSFGGRLTQMFAAATARHQRSIYADDQQDTDGLSNEGSQDECDSASGSDREPADDANTGSDDDDNYEDDAKSSPLFVEDDEMGQPSDSLLGTKSHDLGDIDDDDDDHEYADEADTETVKEVQEGSEVEVTERAGHEPSEETQKRTQAFLKGGAKGRYSIQSLLQQARVDEDLLERRLQQWAHLMKRFDSSRGHVDGADGQADDGVEAENAEEKLSLAINKGDFGKMKIVGQFNLGFILAVRPSTTAPSSSNLTSTDSIANPLASTQEAATHNDDDELFIIDQHASDEKYNFERLQSVTVVQSQRLVRPKTLELTAVEEEIVIENQPALEKNGFIVSVDESGNEPVGSRCQLLSLPLSRETTFSLTDLEELISLLGDNPTTTTTAAAVLDVNSGDEEDGDFNSSSSKISNRYVPRPSKVRKMFAMRACRCSIMIGKALSHRQMETVVRHMGGMEKPWNCPHGRPTMRHLCGLGSAWDQRGWTESDTTEKFVTSKQVTDWAGYVRQKRAQS